MTEILCYWINEEIGLSKKVDIVSFERDFSTGFLIGELLNKYNLQTDFDQFSQNTTTDAKLNNFIRLQPSLHQLGVRFDTNVARDIMSEKHGSAIRLLYQLFIALSKKKKTSLTNNSMEAIKAYGITKLCVLENSLNKSIPSEANTILEALSDRYHSKQIEMEKIAFKDRFREEERIKKHYQKQRQEQLDRSLELQSLQSEVIANIQTTGFHKPTAPSKWVDKSSEEWKVKRRRMEGQAALKDIDSFEEKMKIIWPAGESGDNINIVDYLLNQNEGSDSYDRLNLIRPRSNSEYIEKIRKRLKEDAAARAEREKRRRKVLIDQMRVHETQEESRKEDLLVSRLLKQSQGERCIAAQLLQTRHEKEVIINNRIFREKQYEKQRLQEFLDALDREAKLAHLAQLEYKEQVRMDQELHDKIAAERAEARYRKHYDICAEIINQIVDMACRVSEYRELTNKKLPQKLMREWKMIFISGLPLFEEIPGDEADEEAKMIEEEKQKLIDEADFLDYKNMTNEWQPPEESELKHPPDNAILGFAIKRLMNFVYPPTPPPETPKFPSFLIKACILGKVFSGKSTCAKQLAQEHGLVVLNVTDLVQQALAAHKSGEFVEIPTSPPIHKEKKLKDLSETEETLPNSLIEMIIKEPIATSHGEVDTKCKDKADNPLIPEQVQEILEVRPFHPGNDEATTNNIALDVDTVTPEDISSEAKDDQDKTEVETNESEDSFKAEPSARAKLGALAFENLKKGESVDPQLTIEILVEAIRCIPEGTGWILDGFPNNYKLATLFEKALSGLDMSVDSILTKEKPVLEKMLLDLDIKKGKMKNSQLITDPRPPPPSPDPRSGIDAVILLEIPDNICLQRAAGRTQMLISGEEYHQEFKPPPEGSATGIGKQEKVVPLKSGEYIEEQIQHRLTAFQDSWPKLENWFYHFGILQKVDATQDIESVYHDVETVLTETLEKMNEKKETTVPTENETQTVEEPPVEVPTELAPPSEEPFEPVEEVVETEKRGKGGKKSGRKGEKDKPTSGKTGKDKEKNSTPRQNDKSDSGKKSTLDISGEISGPKKDGKSKKHGDAIPELELESEESPGPPPPVPGSEEWEFAINPLDLFLAKALTEHWKTVETAYLKNCKYMFRKIREEREVILSYLYQVRIEFADYLRRPDHKQEFLSQWQKEYNEIADDMRNDVETQAELHQTVDDFQERIWSICDERKEQAEKLKDITITNGWLEDRLGILSNYYISLMQAEVDRFQDTLRLLKDYYKAMDSKIPDKFNPNYIRISLIELLFERVNPPPTLDETAVAGLDMDKSEQVLKDSQLGSPSSKHSNMKSPWLKSPKQLKSPRSGKKDRNKEKEREEEEEVPPLNVRIKIPLLPQQQRQSPEGFKKKFGRKSNEADTAELSISHEKLLCDVYSTAVSEINAIMSTEQTIKEEEEEQDRLKAIEKEKQRQAALNPPKKGKGKDKSQSPKKGKKDKSEPLPTPFIEEETEEEKQMKLTKEKMTQEYYFAIDLEEAAVKTRLELIKLRSIEVLQDLRSKVEELNKDMNDWLGSRFLKEMESIEKMSEVMRFAIEKKEKIKEELVLQQEDFFINEENKVLRSPFPSPPPTPKELPSQENFTVRQLLFLHKQFLSTDASGVITSKSFVQSLENMISILYGSDKFPDLWMNASSSMIKDIANSLSSVTGYVDWHRFLLYLCQPLPCPNFEQLKATLYKFMLMDEDRMGYLNSIQYGWTDLWFNEKQERSKDTRPKFNRLAHLKKALFDIFADYSQEVPLLYYVDMLLYFCASTDARTGFYQALSLASMYHILKTKKNDEISARLIAIINQRESEVSRLFDMVDVSTSPITHSLEYTVDKNTSPASISSINMVDKQTSASLISLTHMGNKKTSTTDIVDEKIAATEVSPTMVDKKISSDLVSQPIMVNEKTSTVSISPTMKVGKGTSPDGGSPIVTADKETSSAAIISTTDEAVAVPLPTIVENILDEMIPIEALFNVLHHGGSGYSKTLGASPDPDDITSMEQLLSVYWELGSENGQPLPYRILAGHPLIQYIVANCQSFLFVNIKGILSCQTESLTEVNLDCKATE